MISLSKDKGGIHKMPEDDTLLDTEEVARYLKVHPKTVINLVERKELKAYKVGRHWRYRRADVDAYLERQQSTKEPEEPVAA
jgi:excisionase family DNA binding protein